MRRHPSTLSQLKVALPNTHKSQPVTQATATGTVAEALGSQAIVSALQSVHLQFPEPAEVPKIKGFMNKVCASVIGKGFTKTNILVRPPNISGCHGMRLCPNPIPNYCSCSVHPAYARARDMCRISRLPRPGDLVLF